MIKLHGMKKILISCLDRGGVLEPHFQEPEYIPVNSRPGCCYNQIHFPAAEAGY